MKEGIYMKQKTGLQMSSSLPVMILLNLSGGTQDACSYFLRDHVFANAQTGNIVLMGCYLISEDLRNSIRYFLPVAFFALGVLMACLIHSRFRHTGKIHWRHLVLTLEIILLFIVGFIPGQLNWLANGLTSFACAMQVQSFRTVTRQCLCQHHVDIGNLRSWHGSNFYKAITEKRKDELKTAAIYLTAIGSFTIGAACGGHLTNHFSYRTIWISCGLLILCFLLMLIEEEDDLEAIEKEERQELKREQDELKEEKKELQKEQKELQKEQNELKEDQKIIREMDEKTQHQ